MYVKSACKLSLQPYKYKKGVDKFFGQTKTYMEAKEILKYLIYFWHITVDDDNGK